jgi:hypothetical protein
MSDWAQEKAEYVRGWPGVYLSRVQLIGLAALFSQAREDALEEAAVALERDCHDDMTRAEEAAAIRALKEKTP